MKITLRQILKDGLNLNFSSKDTWICDLVKNVLEIRELDLPTLQGHVHLDNTNDNVLLTGKFEFTYSVPCARCGEILKKQLKAPVHALFVPATSLKVTNLTKKEEAKDDESTLDDVDFCTYRGEELDIAPPINDEIALNLPYNDYCDDEKECEARLSEVLKLKNDNADPRLSALAKFKFPRSQHNS